MVSLNCGILCSGVNPNSHKAIADIPCGTTSMAVVISIPTVVVWVMLTNSLGPGVDTCCTYHVAHGAIFLSITTDEVEGAGAFLLNLYFLRLNATKL